jgi:phospholipid-binding lipoprotein MlaA
MSKSFSAFRCILSLVLLLSFQAAANSVNESDPFENVNRSIFNFNQKLDDYFLRPMAKFYVAVTPDSIERGISNLFSNLSEITNASNNLLQGKASQASIDLGRFTLNSTLGVVGLFDVASSFGLKSTEGEDFGQTWGKWGVPAGPYIMLPFLGPATLRDAPARFVDDITDPLDYIDEDNQKMAATGLSVVSMRASLLNYDNMLSGDSYSLIRDVYLQKRAYEVNDGAVEDEFDDLDDY